VARAKELFSGQAAVEAVVAFSPRIARWIRERYPEGHDAPDGRYHVRFQVADPRWLAREVLQYGAEAEVIEPKAVRETIRGMLGG
jgi:predicted DNA-binding transcriptional regulator YafY